MGYDRKYGQVTTEHGDIPADEPVIVFRARDRLLPGVLQEYRDECAAQQSPQRHLDLIDGSLEQIRAWQQDHPGQVRTPDSERSREWMDH